VLLTEGGAAVAGGGFMRHRDPGTAEVKRMWTAAAHRRRGLARRVLTELELRAAARGYRRLVLTTGPRQPEARDLYLAAGWTPLFDPAVPRPTDLETLRALPVDQRLYAFEKDLP
jgi:GNAT superfamily N-acetyltransferase